MAQPPSPARAGEPLTYQQAGVDYARIDPLKILAQQAAAATAPNLARHGLAEVAASRGESAYVVDCGEFYLASITECLGTKALVADQMRAITGPQLLRPDRAGHAGDGDQRHHHGRRHAGFGARLLGHRRQRLVRRRGARARPGRRLARRMRCLRRGVGRRRNAGAGRRGRRRAHRPRGVVRRPRPAEVAADARRKPRGRRCDRAACIERHPRQRRVAGAQAGRAGSRRLRRRARRWNALRRRAARADDPVFTGDRSPGGRRHRAALQRQHHRARLAQADAPPGPLHLPHSHAAAGAAGAALHRKAGRHRQARGLRQPEHGCRLRAVRRSRRCEARGGDRGGARRARLDRRRSRSRCAGAS